jgi:phospholipase/lecithinase/hemolysin
MEKIAGNKANMLQERVAQQTKIQQHMEQFRKQNEQLQGQLDQSIDEMENKMTDIANVVEYDADRLVKKIQGVPGSKGTSEEVPCLTERTNIAMCMAGSKKSCDFYISALEECVNQTIRQ